MEKSIKSNNIIDLLEVKMHQKLTDLANKSKVSPNILLNTLIDDEIERQRLLEISSEIQKEESKKAIAPTQKIVKICNKHLSVLDHKSESLAIRKAIENLHRDLLKQKIIYVNARKSDIIESRRLKTTRSDYYWFSSILAKRIAMWFGTLDIYLWHDLFNPYSELIFIGMPSNVEVCYQIFLYLYNIFKKAKINYKKESINWGSKHEVTEAANRYICKFAQELDYTQAYIENDNNDKVLYEYADEKYAYAMRD